VEDLAAGVFGSEGLVARVQLVGYALGEGHEFD